MLASWFHEWGFQTVPFGELLVISMLHGPVMKEREPFVEFCDPTRQTNPIPSSINRPIADEQPGPVRYTYQPSLETFINLSSAYTSIDPHHHIILWHESGKLVWLTITGKGTLIWIPTTLKEIKEEMLGSRIHIQIPGINTTRQAIRHVISEGSVVNSLDRLIAECSLSNSNPVIGKT